MFSIKWCQWIEIMSKKIDDLYTIDCTGMYENHLQNQYANSNLTSVIGMAKIAKLH